MSRWWMTLLIATGCSTVTIEGQIVDGLDKAAVAGPYRVQAKAASVDAAISCQVIDGEVDAEGKFKLEGLCSGTAYTLTTDRADLWLVEGIEVPDGGWGEAPKGVLGYRVPADGGLYKLSKGEIEPIKTAANVAVHTIWKSTETVRAPEAIPNALTNIGAEDYLVLVGKSAVDDLKFFPLVSYAGKRYFGDDAKSYSVDDWAIVGAKSVNDTTYEPMSAQFDAAKLVDKSRGDQKVRYIPGSALPAGRYAALKDDDKRMYLVDFGTFSTSP